jgi:hypothetical protein
MAKKNRLTKRVIKAARDAFREEREQIEEFIREATPLELSEMLAHTGVSTCNRLGILEVLCGVNSPDNPEALADALTDRWLAESEAKNFELDDEQITFIFALADYFATLFVTDHKMRTHPDLIAHLNRS